MPNCHVMYVRERSPNVLFTVRPSLSRLDLWREHIRDHILDFDLPARAVSRIRYID